MDSYSNPMTHAQRCLKLARSATTGAFQAQWVVRRADLPRAWISWCLWTSQTLWSQKKIPLGNFCQVFIETIERWLISFIAQLFWLISRWILLFTWWAQNSSVIFLAIIARKKNLKGQSVACFQTIRQSLSNQKLWNESSVSSTERIKLLLSLYDVYSNNPLNRPLDI